MLVHICACLWESLYGVSYKHAHRHTKIMHFSHKHPVEHITGCWYIYVRAYENPYMVCLISTLIGTWKLCTLVIGMLMSILQDVATYTGRAYENPYFGCIISTFIGTRKLCTLVISMHMSILQDIDTYTGRVYENPYMGCLISTS
jgi:hypothetical protein